MPPSRRSQPTQFPGRIVEPVVDVVHRVTLTHTDDLELLCLDFLRRERAPPSPPFQGIDNAVDEIVDRVEVVALPHANGAEGGVAADGHQVSLLIDSSG